MKETWGVDKWRDGHAAERMWEEGSGGLRNEEGEASGRWRGGWRWRGVRWRKDVAHGEREKGKDALSEKKIIKEKVKQRKRTGKVKRT